MITKMIYILIASMVGVLVAIGLTIIFIKVTDDNGTTRKRN